MTRFRDHHRTVTAALAATLAAGALAGCGGDDETAQASGPVATIEVPDGKAIPIERQQFDRFYRAAVAAEQNREVANIVPLEGPEYAKCVADDKKLPIGKGKQPAELKTACAARAERLRESAVGQAVNLQWIIAEAAAQGVTPSDAEVAAKAKELDATLTKTGGKAAFLKRTGFTQADLDLNARSGAAQVKLITKATAGKTGKAVDEAKTTFRTEFFDRWKARTACGAGFETPTVCGKSTSKQT